MVESARRAWLEGRPWLWFDRRHEQEGWLCGSFLDQAPRLKRSSGVALDRLDATVRRRRGGLGGVVLMLGYDALTGRVPQLPREALAPGTGDPAPIPNWALFECDPSSVQPPSETPSVPPAERFASSLPRRAHIEAVLRAQEQISRGDIYQVNVCQQIRASSAVTPIDLYTNLAASQRPPFGALVQGSDWALASWSPERFLSVDRDGTIRTEPIKGTRRREIDPELDRRAREELAASEKDRAELLMIVDLERNDFGRLCRPGSIRVEGLYEMRSYPSVHHLVATVLGELREGWLPSELLRATFPGGSITGAPKRRAMEIIADVEGVPRYAFTGSLFWFGDDGSVDASILIRTATFHPDGQISIGAGGGIVADSDPFAEWEEANTKARPICRALGFEPEHCSDPLVESR